jgi:hypothetical protein
MHRLTTFLAALTVGLALTACQGVSVSTGYPGTYGGSGNFADFGVDFYNQGGEVVSQICGMPSTRNDSPVLGANQLSSDMRSSYWTETRAMRDDCNEVGGASTIGASDINASFANADLVYLTGHGDDGAFALSGFADALFTPNHQCWGPGPNSGGYCHNSPGRINGKTKWILAYASDTASAPLILWPSHPEYTTNWVPAFGGSLHGIYGFWQGQGSCGSPADKFRACDISANKSVEFAKEIVAQLITDVPNQTVHQAWINAQARAAGGASWAIWEDFFCQAEYISSQGGCTPSGSVHYFNPQRVNGVYVGSIAVGHDTMSLQPFALVPESASDSTLLSRAQPYIGNPDTYGPYGGVTKATKNQARAEHNSTTGEIVMYGTYSGEPLGFDMATAQNAAISSIQNSQGMPGDAVLSSINAFYRTSTVDGSSVVTAYEFIWKHSGMPMGTDGIRVIVNDNVQTQDISPCLEWDYTSPDPPQKPVKYCATWTQVVSHTPNISFEQRIWRTQGALRYPLGRGPGQQALDAATAATSLPAGLQVVAYSPGYWTPYSIEGSTQALPAWVFQISGGGEAYIDAYSGEYLGTLNE